MKKGWEYSTIGDLCDKINGLWKGKVGPFVNVGVIRNANFTKAFTLSFDNIEYLDIEAKQYKTRKLQKGDLIVEKSGGSEKQPVGRTVLFDKEDGEYSFSNFTSVLRIKDRNIISPEFLYKYILFVYLRGDTRKMQKATTGIHNIEFDKFLAIPVPKLSLPEQQRIVNYLDSAFAKIDAMKANAEKALNEANAFFQASLKEMLEPKEGWEEKKFGDVCWYNKNNGIHKGTKYVGMEHIEQGTGTLMGTISSDDVLSNTFAFKKGDVLYGRLRPYLKKVIVADFDGCCSTEIFPIQSKEIIPSFLMYWFLTDEITNKVNATCAGCRMPRGNMNDVLKFDISFPPLSEQQRIVATLDSLKSKVDRLQENYNKISQECDALKQALLREVFEG